MVVQSVCKALGASGCYFLSLLHLVDADLNALTLYDLSVRKKYLDYDCFVENPAGILNLATGYKWTVRYENADYKTLPTEREILRFERKTTTVTYAHFVVGDGLGNVVYDPLGDSETVKSGKLVSKRIVTKNA